MRPKHRLLSTQVQSYQVEWDTNPGVAEVQTVTTSTYLGANELQTIRTFGKDVDEIQLVRTLARPHREEQWVTATAPAGSTLAGTFALALDTRPTGGTLQYTGAIPASAAACCGRTSVLAMVEALQNVGLGMVTKVKREDVSIDGRAGFQWQIQFNETLADLPQLQVLDASGLTLGSTVTVATETEGNAISGTFRLTFGGDTTALIAADATAGEVEDALELLDTVTDVTVVRGDAQPFGGFSWWVTFVHDDQGGDQPLLTPVYEGTLLGLSGDPWVETSEVRAGNTLSGSFNVSFAGVDGVHPGTTVIQHDATAEDVVEALTRLPGVPTGTVAVSRSGPDPENGYVWTVSFLDDAERTWEKDLGDDFDFEIASTANLIGVDARAKIEVLREGTMKEIQLLNVTRGGGNDTKNDYFYLEFGGQITGKIFAASDPKTGECGDAVPEVQRISSRTVDTTASGGDAAVSPRTTFRLGYGRETTGYIYAANGGDCSVAGAKIEAELEALDAFYEVDVASSATLGSHECDWDVTFSTTAGNLDQLSISVSRDAAGAEDGPSSSAQAGDDTMTVATTTEGRTDIVQSELEALSTIGRVTVSVESAGVKDDGSEGIEWLEKRRTGTCLYRVTFDTNAGDLPMIAICGDPNCAVNHRSNVDGQGVQNFQRGVPDLEYITEPYPQSQSFTTVDESGTFTDSDTTLSVAAAADLTGLAANSYIRVGSEIMLVTAIASDDLTVTRGQSGTTAAAHADGAVVDLLTQSTVATSDITAVATTVNVALNTGGLGAAAKSYIRIGKEVMLVSSISTNALTVVRAQDGTTAATHAIGATVYLLRESTLDGALTVLTTTVNVDLNTAGLGAAVNDYILIGSEVMLVTKVATNTLTVTRAQDGTAATTHADAAKVYLLQSSTQQVKATYALPQPESTIATGNEADNGNAVGITTIDVTLNTAALDAAVNSYIQIGSEVMLVTGVNTNELTVTRGTSPAVHADGAKVYRLAQTTIATGNAADNGATTTATTIDVTLNTAALDAAVNSYVQIGSEVMLVTAVSTNELTVTRGTSPGTHADGAKVYRLTESTLDGPLTDSATTVNVDLNTAGLGLCGNQPVCRVPVHPIILHQVISRR